MRSIMKKAAAVFLLFLLSDVTCVLGGVTGRLTGKVVDRETGDPLPGVRIEIGGTPLTTVTNTQGEFLIIGIDAGTYSVKAEMEGYSKVTYFDLTIYADLLNKLDMELSAQRDEDRDIHAEIASSLFNDPYQRRLVTSSAFFRQPHRSLQDLILQSSGDVYQRAIQPNLPMAERHMRDNELFFRGGAAREAGYYLDGLSLNDGNTGATFLSLPYGALDQAVVQTGGYEAKYGSFGAGMVQVVPKRAGRTFSGSAEITSDGFASIFGADNYGRNIYSFTLSGPISDDNLRFFSALDYSSEDDAEPGRVGYPLLRFSPEGLRNFDPNLNDTVLFATRPDGRLKYEYGARPGGVNLQELINFYADVSYVPNAAMQFDLVTLYASTQRNQYRTNYLLAPGGVPRQERTSFMIDLSGKYFLSPALFLQGHIGTYTTEDKIAAKDFFSMGDQAIGLLNASTRGNTFSNTYYGDNFLVDIDREYLGYKQSESEAWFGGLQLNWQYNKEHFIESGFEYSSHTERLLDLYDIGYPSQLGANNIYGYRIELNGANDFRVIHQNNDKASIGAEGPKKPTTAAFFLQDHYSVEKFTFTGGIRADYFSNGVKTTELEYYAGTISNKRKSFYKWSPRMALSTEFSKNITVRANYGWFYRIPAFENYLLSNNMLLALVTRRPFQVTVSNPVLKPEKTEATELGIHCISKGVTLDASFFRNEASQVIMSGAVENNPIRMTLSNAGSRSVYGFNIGFENRVSENFAAGSYATILRSKTNTVDSSSGFRSDWLMAGQAQANVSSDHEQRNVLKIFAEARLLRGQGPLIADGRPLENTSLFLWISWASGFPYTPTAIRRYMYSNATAAVPIGDRNSRTTPSTMTVDVKITKQFKISDTYLATAYIEIWNLLNRKNPVQVFSATGRPDTDGYANSPSTHLTSREAQQYQYLMRNSLNYSNPRMVSLGCKFDF